MAHTADMGIYYSTDPAVLSTGTYPITTRVGGYLEIYLNPQSHLQGGLTTLDDGFPRLSYVEQHVDIRANPYLVTLGDAFPALVHIGTENSPNFVGGFTSATGMSLYVNGNPLLQSLGSAFASLRRIPGTLRIEDNPLLTDFEALRNLECHGGAYLNNPARYCQGCPTWLLAKPQCQTAAPTTAPPTTAPPTTATPTTAAPTIAAPTTLAPTVTGVARSGDIDILSSTDPLVLSTANYPVTTSVAGRVHIGDNPGLTTLGFQTVFRDAPTGVENAFPRLTQVEGELAIYGNANLVTLGGAFPDLVELGTGRNGRSLVVHNNAALRSLGSAFASLRRIPGTIWFSWGGCDFEALRNLECHGGVYGNNPSGYCMGCPGWLLALPRCN